MVDDKVTALAPKKLEIKKTSDSSQTFIFGNEDHTLGNSLRYVLMQSSDTSFCGYSVPHPNIPKLNLRLQTTGKPAPEVMHEGLETLIKVCDHVTNTFDEALERM